MNHRTANLKISLFATPKPFQGHIGTIQRNAIQSWTKLGDGCEILLFGSDYGVAETASELGLSHFPDVAVNENGTPLVNDLFDQAEQAATSNMMCYVNADIILMGDFLEAVAEILATTDRFLMVGQRWDLDLLGPWSFDSADWESRLAAKVIEEGTLHAKSGIDFFVFSKGLLSRMPPFAIGRTAWDNWIIYRAHRQAVPVIDATGRVMAVHQNHDYGNFGSKTALWTSREARANQKLMGINYCTLDDVSHFLQPDGLHYAWTLRHMVLHPRRLMGRYPILSVPDRIKGLFLRRASSWKSTLNLTRAQWMVKKS